MRARYLLLLFFLLSCESNFSNERWGDGSLKTIIKKERFKNEHTFVVYRFKQGEQDSSNYYLKEILKKTGQIIEKAEYLDKKRNGKYEAWYSNRQKSVECSYKNGKEEGLYISWFPNGDILEKMLLKEGKVVTQ